MHKHCTVCYLLEYLQTGSIFPSYGWERSGEYGPVILYQACGGVESCTVLWHCGEAASGDRKVLVWSLGLEQKGLAHLKITRYMASNKKGWATWKLRDIYRKFFVYLTSPNIWKFCPHLPAFVILLHNRAWILKDKLMSCLNSLLKTEEERAADFYGFVMR